MILADFQPSILFLILWGILSWLTRKKSKKKVQNNDTHKQTEPKEGLLSRLQKLQENLSSEFEILAENNKTGTIENNAESKYDNFYVESPQLDLNTTIDDAIDIKNDFDSPDIDHYTDDKYNKDEDRDIFSTKRDEYSLEFSYNKNWIKQTLHNKNELRKLILLNTIIGKPRSLNQFEENNL